MYLQSALPHSVLGAKQKSDFSNVTIHNVPFLRYFHQNQLFDSISIWGRHSIPVKIG